MVSVPHANKHLIKFPIALDYTTLRRQIEDSTTTPQTVLLKADTGADVNLMSRQMFSQLFGKAKVLQPTPSRMENYGNSAIKVLGTFYAFLRWKDKVYKQLFYITDCDKSPNLLSRDAFYTFGVLKPCYTVENSTKHDTKSELSFLHQKMNGPEKKLSDNSTKHSISREQLQGSPLTKQDILETYANIFTGTGKFPGLPYKFQLKPNANLLDMHLGKCL